MIRPISLAAVLLGAALISGCVNQTTVESKHTNIATPSGNGQRVQIRTALVSEYFQRRNSVAAIEDVDNTLKALLTYVPAHLLLGPICM